MKTNSLKLPLPKLLQTLPQALPGPPRAMPRFGGVQGGVRARFDCKNMWFLHDLEFIGGSRGSSGSSGSGVRKLLQTLPQVLPGPPRAMPRFGGFRGGSGLVLTVKTRIKCAIWNSPGDLRGSPAISGDLWGSPRKWSQEPLVGGPLPTRHGQDDGSLTNSLKL